MRHGAAALVAGCALVAVAAAVSFLLLDSWRWFAAGNGALAFALVFVAWVAISDPGPGDDRRTPPTDEHWPPILDPGKYAVAYHVSRTESRSGREGLGFSLAILCTAVPPVLAVILALIRYA